MNFQLEPPTTGERDKIVRKSSVLVQNATSRALLSIYIQSCHLLLLHLLCYS